MTASARISNLTCLQYGLLAMPVAFAGFPLYVLAPDFYATHYGLSLSMLGGILLCIRLFDAVQDPLLGWLLDRFRSHLAVWIMLAAVTLTAAVAGMFNIVIFSPAIWFAVTMIFAVSAHSLISIAMGAYATLRTSDPLDQTLLAGTREAFGLIGLIIAVSTPTLLQGFTETDTAYVIYSFILAALMLCGVIAFRNLKKPHSYDGTGKRNYFILSSLKNLPRETRQLLMVYAISMLASSIPAVLVIFYVRDLLYAENMTGVFLLVYFLSGVISMPFWKKISERHGKYKSWMISIFIAVTAFIGAFFLGSGDVWPYAAICIISGFALGADLCLPPSILADDIHRHQQQHFANSYSALLAFLSKASLALASATALFTLDAAGFIPQQANSETALLFLSLSYAVIPCLLKLIAAGMLYHFFIRPNQGNHHETSTPHPHPRSANHA